jgi:hypothetical protein
VIALFLMGSVLSVQAASASTSPKKWIDAREYHRKSEEFTYLHPVTYFRSVPHLWQKTFIKQKS